MGVPAGGEIATICPYCGVGCGVLVQPSQDGLSAAVRGQPDHPANFGNLCSKGAALGETLGLDDRILVPSIGGQDASWDQAMDKVVRGFSEAIREYGPDSVAFYVSGQILTEDYYVANKLMKGFIGSSNIDTNSRLCMASSVAGHKRAFGTDTVPGCYEDLDSADLIVLVGSNLAWCHPILFQRILKAKDKRGTKLVVIDPRQTASTESADMHLAIKPGTDVLLFNALFRHLTTSGARDCEFVLQHTTGLADALEATENEPVEDIAEACGLPVAQMLSFFQLFEATERTVTVYSQGVNQSSAGSDKVNSIINCHLVTGRIGRPGMGPLSATGQTNAMGGREVGGLANQLASHLDFTPADIDLVSRFWRAPNLATGPGLKAVDMFDSVADGRIKAIWIMSTNPVVSLPNADKIKTALEICPMVVVSEVVWTSETLKYADVVLPATAWGEKSGTVTNSERRISRQRSFLKAPGEARADWWAMAELGRRLGFEGFDFNSPADIYREYAALSAFENEDSRDFDIGAHADITAQEYDALKPFQWPLVKGRARPGSALYDTSHRFFSDGQFYTPDRKARFVATRFRPAKSQVNDKYPFVLNTGRIRDQWHTMTRTGKTQRLTNHIAEPYLEIHPEDAAKCGIEPASIVEVWNGFGRTLLRALITKRVQRGCVFAPMHWSGENSSAGRVDSLVAPNVDPISGQPESKHSTVQIKAYNADWFAFVVSRTPLADDLLANAEYWAKAQVQKGWRYELAGLGEATDLLAAFAGADCLTLDSHPRQHARALMESGELTSAVILQRGAPVTAERSWLVSVLGQKVDDQTRLFLLAGKPPKGVSSGRAVCSCMGVGSAAIEDAVSKGAQTVEGIGAATGAGTNCGSCKPEIRAILQAMKAKNIDATSIAAE